MEKKQLESLASRGGILSRRQKDRKLLKWAQEFQPKQTYITEDVLSFDPGDNGWGFTGNETRRGWGGGWYRQVHGLFGAQDVGGGNAGASCTNIESFRQLNEFQACGVGRSQKDRNLQAKTGGATSMGGVQTGVLVMHLI
jgi:hypothetical protein